jgi:hypothetical protein
VLLSSNVTVGGPVADGAKNAGADTEAGADVEAVSARPSAVASWDCAQGPQKQRLRTRDPSQGTESPAHGRSPLASTPLQATTTSPFWGRYADCSPSPDLDAVGPEPELDESPQRRRAAGQVAPKVVGGDAVSNAAASDVADVTTLANTLCGCAHVMPCQPLSSVAAMEMPTSGTPARPSVHHQPQHGARLAG